MDKKSFRYFQQWACRKLETTSGLSSSATSSLSRCPSRQMSSSNLQTSSEEQPREELELDLGKLWRGEPDLESFGGEEKSLVADASSAVGKSGVALPTYARLRLTPPPDALPKVVSSSAVPASSSAGPAEEEERLDYPLAFEGGLDLVSRKRRQKAWRQEGGAAKRQEAARLLSSQESSKVDPWQLALDRWETMAKRVLARDVDKELVEVYCGLTHFVRTGPFQGLPPAWRWRIQRQLYSLGIRLDVDEDFGSLDSAPAWWRHVKRLSLMRQFPPAVSEQVSSDPAPAPPPLLPHLDREGPDDGGDAEDDQGSFDSDA